MCLPRIVLLTSGHSTGENCIGKSLLKKSWNLRRPTRAVRRKGTMLRNIMSSQKVYKNLGIVLVPLFVHFSDWYQVK